MDITCDFLAIRLDEREFAIPLDKVCELRNGSDVNNMLERNGEQIPVYDLHGILSLPSICPKGAFDIVVVKSKGRKYAIAVDDATDVVTLPVEEFMLVTSPATDRNHIWAITMHEERVLRLLDTDSLEPITKTVTVERERLAA
jgi:chemotaxis signal transduction protein